MQKQTPKLRGTESPHSAEPIRSRHPTFAEPIRSRHPTFAEPRARILRSRSKADTQLSRNREPAFCEAGCLLPASRQVGVCFCFRRLDRWASASASGVSTGGCLLPFAEPRARILRSRSEADTQLSRNRGPAFCGAGCLLPASRQVGVCFRFRRLDRWVSASASGVSTGGCLLPLAGDVQGRDQVELLLPNIAAEKLRCDILVAPAHGIDAEPEFARAARPKVTIASAGGSYAKSSPSPKVYGAVGSRVFATGIHGRVSVTSDGRSFTVDAERPDAKVGARVQGVGPSL
jgi:hypothetical protein